MSRLIAIQRWNFFFFFLLLFLKWYSRRSFYFRHLPSFCNGSAVVALNPHFPAALLFRAHFVFPTYMQHLPPFSEEAGFFLFIFYLFQVADVSWQKHCSPFLVTVATLDKRAYKYIPGKTWGSASASSSHSLPVPAPGPVVITVHTKGERAKVQSGAAAQLMQNFHRGC